MKKNLRIKFLIIAGIVLACIYGIIGLPTSKAQLVDNWNRNIHLGLDLRGGTYLVVQVQEQDAFNSEANTSGRSNSAIDGKATSNRISRSPGSEVARGCAQGSQS